MSYAQTKADFVRDCFRDILSDGEPHRYREILDYIREQAEGTEFEGTFEQNNMVVDIRPLIGNTDSEYARIKHGIYQLKPPEEIIDTASDGQKGDFYSLLDHFCELQNELQDTIAEYGKAFPDAPKFIATDYQYAEKCLDESINGISAWIAHIEDYADESVESEDEDECQTMQM